MKCQQTIIDVLGCSGDHVCSAPVSAWRSCGLGCKHEIAYCADHGGDKRAGVEVVEHHARVHKMECFGAGCPCKNVHQHNAWVLNKIDTDKENE